MPLGRLALPFGALSIEADDDAADDDAEALDASYRLTDLGSTVTFEAGGIKLRGRRGIQRDDGGEASSFALTDLERGHMLGQGASSKVWLCRDKRSGAALALKQLTAMSDPSARSAAVNELKLAQKAAGAHQHMMRFIDAYFDEGHVLILMELADAGSLDDAIRKAQGVPERVLRSAVVQLLRGLHHLHSALCVAPRLSSPPPVGGDGTALAARTLPLPCLPPTQSPSDRHRPARSARVHRDLKPANVMLTRRGLVKLADFGISRELDGGAAQLAMTQCGTTSYMSPERLYGEAYDAKR
mmetsp:Transcript_35133/g.102987  ORF Transcript_35133/g.102987 Transcript_35133/m.102987 type:complete len:299 (-) Transcript_35133:68-964(-)